MYLFEILETRENLSIIDYFKKLLGRLPKEAFFNNKNHFDDPTARPGWTPYPFWPRIHPSSEWPFLGSAPRWRKYFSCSAGAYVTNWGGGAARAWAPLGQSRRRARRWPWLAHCPRFTRSIFNSPSTTLARNWEKSNTCLAKVKTTLII